MTPTMTRVEEPASWRTVLEAIRDGQIEPPPAATLIGLELLGVGDGRATFRYTPRPDHGNPGSVHGGVLAMVADFAVSTAVATLLPPGSDVVTADLHVAYHRRVDLDDPPLLATGMVLHLGRSQASAEASLHDRDGVAMLHALATCRIIDPARAERRS